LIDEQKQLPGFPDQELIFGGQRLSSIQKEIRDVYLSDNRPWVIGYSGGKDSTTALQLTWYALKQLPPNKLVKPIYVISSDTLVETPLVVDHIHKSLEQISKQGSKEAIPVTAQLVRPNIKDSFWVNLIGKGYPIPYTRSRWCTDRLKISPANRFILDKVAEHGEVILILGVRKAESATRAQVINMRSIKNSILKSHTSLPGAYVYAPIVDFSTQDVWDYLIEVQAPWGNENTNKELFNLYKSANSEECPLVIDKTTPSCGNSRFGCWVCTVVKKDHSMESLIKSGEQWMAPLLKFRNIISTLAEPNYKYLYRDHRRRDGKVYFKKDTNEIAWGQTRIDKGFSKKAKNKLRGLGLEVREKDTGLPQVLLRELLKIQNDIQSTHPDLTIISSDEIHEIRRLWKTEQHDWEDLVPQIYFDVTNKSLNWVEDDVSGFTQEDMDTLEKLCKSADIPVDLIVELLGVEREFHGMSRRSNIYKKLNKVFSKEWRDIDVITESAKIE